MGTLDSTGKRVLIIDDSRMARIMITRVLNELRPGWQISEARGAEEALAVVDGENFDVIFVDVNMPGMGGLELSGLLRERFPDTPIALVTANIQASVQRHGMSLGIPVLPKPAKPELIAAFLDGLS